MSLTKRNLEMTFENAVNTNALYVGVKISTAGSLAPEVIINPKDNFNDKLEYYREKYDEDLVLKSYSGIKIIGLTFANSYEDIECDFEDSVE
ncbi:hypothetical protein G9F71_008840 [Clostridium sp. FP2]|uniref:hypothetical protein n=1 Tax=Clostridium sp. FP2 TaxID=2724481 RepID=UPI0013E96F79|nr:hypothetical protein [Clostridium sp. FP2]MBZ9622960.1 hypothetical protein [Clostridium sp. FP2]